MAERRHETASNLGRQNGLHGSNGAADVINSRGEAVGLSENTTLDPTCPPYDPSKGQSQKLQQKPVLWRNGHVRELPTIGGDPDGNAFAINDDGQIAGGSGTCSSFNFNNFLYLQFTDAVLWNNGRPIDLEILAEALATSLFGINNRGDVVGASDLKGDNAFNAFLWTRERGKMQGLAPLGTDILSVGLAINDDREVTGVSLDENFQSRAVLWLHQTPIDLNTLIPSTAGLYLLLACSVNDKGQIIGLAVDSNGAFHGYLATPRSDKDGHDAALDGPMHLSDNVREMVRKQLHLGSAAKQATP